MSDEREVAVSDGYRSAAPAERVAAAVSARLGDGLLRRVLRAGYRAMLSVRTRGRGIECVLPEGERVRLLPAFRFATWHPDEYAAFRAALRPGDVALDVGANVGAYTLLFGQWVGAQGRVYAFEPSPAAYAGLAGHVALNRLSNVALHSQAVGDHTGRMSLRDEGVHGTTRAWLPSDGAAARRDVAVTTLDDFCRRHGIRPRLIKIDVEGAEAAVLRGAREVIAASPDVAVFVELHPTVWQQMGTSRQQLLDELAAQGLRIEPLRADSDPWSVEGVCVRLVRD